MSQFLGNKKYEVNTDSLKIVMNINRGITRRSESL